MKIKITTQKTLNISDRYACKYQFLRLMFTHVHVSVCVYVCECVPCVGGCPQRPEDHVRSPEAQVTGNCELSPVGAGN